ncbi:hypothetical protein V1502_03235 [Bacillus sp. SCS-153A]|uniref:hypothetical protein n=1 Tax=Rossellomorea sedimentorum TaxID=3115294 RepID=UPI00390676CD
MGRNVVVTGLEGYIINSELTAFFYSEYLKHDNPKTEEILHINSRFLSGRGSAVLLLKAIINRQNCHPDWAPFTPVS